MNLNGKLNPRLKTISVILAAGKGKRIKSEKAKVLHKVWGVPSVVRVCNAAKKGLNCPNHIVVVKNNAEEVMELVKDRNTVFVLQNRQKGTGHALQVALKAINKSTFNNSVVYVFPGDIGLLNEHVVREFKKKFESGDADAMMVTGCYEASIESNPYGRIVRIPEKDEDDNPSGRDFGKVAEILQLRDILQMDADMPHRIIYNGKTYHFTKQQLLEIREFDALVYAFRLKKLREHINKLKSDNVQGELYLTDLVKIYNKAGLQVDAHEPKDSSAVLGFNCRSELKKMESIIRARYFDVLKDIVFIEDEENFFIGNSVLHDILRMDRRGINLDILLGEGCFISNGVKLNVGVSIGKRAVLEGNIILGKRANIGENVHISTYPHQKLYIGDDTQILQGDIIKGNTRIGKNVRIETGVTITGSDEFPAIIGDNCIIKGTTYVFGSKIEGGNWIQHSVIVTQKVERIVKKDGSLQKIKYILPPPEGRDSISPLNDSEL